MFGYMLGVSGIVELVVLFGCLDVDKILVMVGFGKVDFEIVLFLLVDCSIVYIEWVLFNLIGFGGGLVMMIIECY